MPKICGPAPARHHRDATMRFADRPVDAPFGEALRCVVGHFGGRDLLQPRSRFLDAVCIVGLAVIGALPGSIGARAAEQSADIPHWLTAHIGEADGQIAPVVLQRARAHYLRKTRDGATSNPCYFAMDATRPSTSSNGRLGRRFYVICEGDKSFRAISAGHGGGRRLQGLADFGNGKRCAKNFSNAMGSSLTTGGAYVTSEQTTSFKGYYQLAGGRHAALVRSFVQFDGEGETANARQREIGGHAAILLRGACLRKKPDSPYADQKGYVPFGTVENYADGRSSGCTSWSPADAGQVVAMMKDKPAALYIYPERTDIDAVARSVKAGHPPARDGLYWSAACLGEIRVPRFWPKENLEPIIARYEKSHPAPPPRPTPICTR